MGCLGSVALGLVCVAGFYAVATLGLQGEVRVPRGDLGELRVWLIREPGYEGLGRSSTRITQGSERSGRACVLTSVRFLMLEAEEPVADAETCECLEKEGEHWISRGECPMPGP